MGLFKILRDMRAAYKAGGRRMEEERYRQTGRVPDHWLTDAEREQLKRMKPGELEARFEAAIEQMITENIKSGSRLP